MKNKTHKEKWERWKQDLGHLISLSINGFISTRKGIEGEEYIKDTDIVKMKTHLWKNIMSFSKSQKKQWTTQLREGMGKIDEKELKLKMSTILDKWTEKYGLETSIDMEWELVNELLWLIVPFSLTKP